MLNSNVELVEASGVTLESLRSKAAEIWTQLGVSLGLEKPKLILLEVKSSG